MQRDVLQESYVLLTGDEMPYHTTVSYTDKFKPYNANIRMVGNHVELRLSKSFRKVSKEIAIGVTQELLMKILRMRKKNTFYTDLYNNFVKSLHISAEIKHQEPILVESFQRVNEAYFGGMIEMPNLIFSDGLRELGHYEYKTDTIAISKVFVKRLDLMDYVMHHEMLHKKHKFYAKGGKTFHHTAAFKQDESKFRNHDELEKDLHKFIRVQKLKRIFF